MNGSTKGGKESAARSANLGGCKGRAANEDRRQTKRTRMGCAKSAQRKKPRNTAGTERSNKPLKERKKKMAKITMMSGIASISGRVGNCCFRTMKATGKVYMHQVNVQRDNVQCTKEPSEAMMRQRKRFAAITKIVTKMLEEGSKKSRKQLWKIATEAYDAANQ